uniref:Queuine tRNA-ribosyltransferase n=1 Tax=uncultured Atribacterota bacterium TaxID=263865 RepID=G3BMR6_9BACT|nr:queuine/archaeosine tRNA-ribosyltransferase [uncultured Atribacterota bacterium]
MSFKFKIIKEINKANNKARVGIMETAHGVVETPVFMPVGTQATIKGILPKEIKELGFSIILCNAYHLFLRPGHALISKSGGLHKFMGWDKVILSDSGGFQVFSLGKINKINDDGVVFQSYINGTRHFINTEKAMEIQMALGSDIAMVFDQCVPFPSNRYETQLAANRTYQWAKECRKYHNRKDQTLFGIIQGGLFPDIRRENTFKLRDLDFPGYALGGLSVGEPKPLMYEMIETVIPLLPTEKPRYLMGVGAPESILEGVIRGIDMFDCVLPTRNGRNGCLFTHNGKISITNAQYKDDLEPLDQFCHCYTCQNFSRAYLRHLYKAQEMLAPILGTIHNLYFMSQLMKNIRKAILENRLESFKREFYNNYLSQ